MRLAYGGFIAVLIYTQTEKHRLKEKAEEERAFKEKASISIPLVDEHADDVKTAKTITFGSSSSEDRRQRRLEIKTQSVFASPGSSAGAKEGGGRGTKRSRALLLEACSSKKRSAGPSGMGKTVQNAPLHRTKELRNSLGIKSRK